jgi:hypothetical protein
MYTGSNPEKKVGLIRTGIALDVDKKYKFRNPKKSGNESLENGNNFLLTWV